MNSTIPTAGCMPTELCDLLPVFIENRRRDVEAINAALEAGDFETTKSLVSSGGDIDLVLRRGRLGETYNVGSALEASIEEIAERLVISRRTAEHHVQHLYQDRRVRQGCVAC